MKTRPRTTALLALLTAPAVITASMAFVAPVRADGPVPITLDGAPVTFSLEVGEEGTATFSGVKGQRVTIQTIATNVTRYPSPTRDVDVDVVNVRTGRTLANVGGDYEDVFDGIGEAVTLPENGDYRVEISPDQGFTGDVTLTLKSPVRAAMSIGGSSTFALGVGEEAIATFEGTKDQIVTVQTLAQSVSRFPSNTDELDVYVFNARTGSRVEYVGGDYEDVFDGIGETVRLPATGQYEIRISPDQYFTGDVTIELLSPETSPVTIGGAPVSFTLGKGSEAVATFSAGQGQRVTVQTSISSDSIYPSSYRNLNVYLVNTRTGKRVSSVGGRYIDVLDGVSRTVTLRDAGNYELRISPTQSFVGVVTIGVTSAG